MFKSFCLALGIFILLVGMECLCVKTFVMKFESSAETVSQEAAADESVQKPKDPFKFSPSKPMAWSLIAVGGFLTLNTLLRK